MAMGAIGSVGTVSADGEISISDEPSCELTASSQTNLDSPALAQQVQYQTVDSGYQRYDGRAGGRRSE